MIRLKSISLMHKLLLMSYITVLCLCWFCVYQALQGSLGNKIEGIFESAYNDHFRVGNSIKTMAENKQYSQDNRRYYLLGAIKNAMESYSRYYSGGDSFFQVHNQNGDLVFDSFPEMLGNTPLSPEQNGSVDYCLLNIEGKNAVFVSSYIKIYSELFRFDYARDVTDPISGEIALAKRMALILSVSLVFLTVFVYTCVQNALKPLNSLREQAKAIAGGNYGLRIRQIHDDEVGGVAAEFNHMAEAVEKHINKVTESSELRELFAANLAHEIKNPITSIIGYADYAVQRELGGKELHKIHNYIKREGKRLDSLSQKLLDWSEIGHHKEAERKPCNVKRLMEHVFMTVGRQIEDRQQKLITKIAVDTVFVDEALFISLLVNLLENSSRASGAESVIEIFMNLIDMGKPQEMRLITTVKDYGTGIGKEDIGRVTEPFYMADKSRDRRNHGSGLGLALCSAIADAHHGSIKIKSQLNIYTEITIDIPQPKNLTGNLQSLDDFHADLL